MSYETESGVCDLFPCRTQGHAGTSVYFTSEMVMSNHVPSLSAEQLKCFPHSIQTVVPREPSRITSKPLFPSGHKPRYHPTTNMGCASSNDSKHPPSINIQRAPSPENFPNHTTNMARESPPQARCGQSLGVPCIACGVQVPPSQGLCGQCELNPHIAKASSPEGTVRRGKKTGKK